ncbi:glycoside hydrolase family 16 protein [Sphingomonas aestuarii]
MSFILFALQVVGLGATNYGIDAPMAAPVSAPAFADEFEDEEVDSTVWRYDASRNAQGWHNNELQYYAVARPKNARIENGALIIEAHQETMSKAMFADWGGQAYSSAKLVSHKPLGYGFYEVRAKLPCGRGAWPAIWMLPEGGSWPEMGEIDIMEMVGWDPKVIHATLHSGTYNHAKGTQRGAQKRVETACNEFHTYQLDWQPDAITIGIDGRAHMRVTNDMPGDKGAWPFDRPFHLILNLAVGGDWGGQKGVDDKAFPMRMTVDYVRHWPVEAKAAR